MQAVTFQGKENIEVKAVAAPSIENTTDMIVRITATGICGSDLHLYHGGITPEKTISSVMNRWESWKR